MRGFKAAFSLSRTALQYKPYETATLAVCTYRDNIALSSLHVAFATSN